MNVKSDLWRVKLPYLYAHFTSTWIRMYYVTSDLSFFFNSFTQYLIKIASTAKSYWVSDLSWKAGFIKFEEIVNLDFRSSFETTQGHNEEPWSK